MRLLARCAHDDHDLGEVYECLDPDIAARRLAGGVALPADEYRHELRRAADATLADEHVFVRIAPEPATEVAPAASAHDPAAPLTQDPAAPTTPAAPDLEVRG